MSELYLNVYVSGVAKKKINTINDLNNYIKIAININKEKF